MVELSSILEIFQDPIFIIAIIVISTGIGITQGHILGRAILIKFPRVQNNAKKISLGLFFLFLINAVLSVPRFASPEKIEISKIFEATSSGEIASIVFTILGINTGFLAVLAISVMVISIILMRSTQISGGKRIFVILVSLFILMMTAFSRFTDYTPSNFEVFLYFLYQLGVTIGIVVGTARKLKTKPQSDEL